MLLTVAQIPGSPIDTYGRGAGPEDKAVLPRQQQVSPPAPHVALSSQLGLQVRPAAPLTAPPAGLHRSARA